MEESQCFLIVWYLNEKAQFQNIAEIGVARGRRQREREYGDNVWFLRLK